MQDFRNILVGVEVAQFGGEGSPYTPEAEHAIEQGIWLAGMLSAKLTFFTALDFSPRMLAIFADETQEASLEHVESQTQNALQQLVTRAKQAGIDAEAELASGTAWKEMMKCVQANGHDLVIIGARSESGLEQILFGSTGRKLLKFCPAALWLTKTSPALDDHVLDVLVPTDFSDVSQHALQIAVNSGQLLDARIHFLHVLEDPFQERMKLSGLSEQRMHEFHEQDQAEAEEKMHDQLLPTDYRTLQHGLQVIVKRGRPETVVTQYLEEQKIDLLIMGTNARSGISGWFIGNTIEQVLPFTRCSVLAIKPEGFQCPVSIED